MTGQPVLDPLIASRAVHFASSLVVGGVAIFSAFIAQPIRGVSFPVGRLQQLMLAALALAVLSGATWLLLLATRIAQSSVATVIDDGTAWSVLTETQFGHVWLGRLLVAIVLLCGCVGGPSAWVHGLRPTSFQAALAILFVGMLAWSGHAAGTMGFRGLLHFGGDVFHLITAAAWVGGLVPLLTFLGPSLRSSEPPLAICYKVLRRFSTLAAWSVAVLAASGVLNTWYLTNGLQSFLGTDYGDLVLVKIALLLVMLGFGAINRYRLTPRLLPTNAHAEPDSRALRLLCASVSIEIALGLVVICVVAVLGQLQPPGHMHHMD
jgi:putative copper resistance protein D